MWMFRKPDEVAWSCTYISDRMLSIEISRADDLIPEESDTVLLALKRLPPKEAYDRVFRLRRAFQVSSGNTLYLGKVHCNLLTGLVLPCSPIASQRSADQA